MKKFYSLAAVLGVAVLVFVAHNVVAQQSANNGSGFKVSPVREELTIDKGGTQTVSLFVENTTNVEVKTKAVANDFEAAGESGEPKLLLDGQSVGANSFKSLVSPIPELTLAPKQKLEVPVTIKVPSNANPGGYYGAIRFQPSTPSSGSEVNLSASVATIFLIKVPGNLNEKLELVTFSAAKDSKTGRLFINASNNLSLVTKLKNTGNIHVKPFGKVQIMKSGKVVEEFELNAVGDEGANILPGQTRQFVNKFKNDKWFGKYNITANLSYGDYGNGSNVITANTTFWVIPSWMATAFVVALVALIFGAVYLIIKKGNKKTKQTHKRR